MKENLTSYSEPVSSPVDQPNRRKNLFKGIISFALTLLLFAFSLELMVKALALVGSRATDMMLTYELGPFVGLFVGLLCTAILQSSSTVTAALVAVVASGSISLANAVPIILGANIGTTLTSTLVSFGFISNRKTFQRAISSASMHDFFNIFTVLIVLPLEYFFQIYTHTATALAQYIPIINLDNLFSAKWLSLDPLVFWLVNIINNGTVVVVISMVLLFASIKLLAKIIYRYLDYELKSTFESLFQTEWKALSTGTLLTMLVQSSSLTTSLIVPLSATRKVQLSKAFPFIIGCNLGTTITALVVGIFMSPTALAIGIVHFLFNLTGVVMLMPFRKIRHSIVSLCIWLGIMTVKYRVIGLLYLIGMFFITPFLLIYFSQ